MYKYICIINHIAFHWISISRFTVTTFENEMKWYSTERSRGKDDYSVPDAMLQFSQKNNVKVRGHNVVWNDPKYLPAWAISLSPNDLRLAVDRRINSVVKRYAGQVNICLYSA